MSSFARAPFICCGCCPCSSVLKTFPTVWCMRLHIALVCGFCWWLEHLWFDNLLIRVGTLVQWIRLHCHGYSELATDIMLARLVHISWQCEPRFYHQFKLVRLGSRLSQSLWEHWTHTVYLELGWSKVRLGHQHIPRMALNESRAQASVRILSHQA